MKFFTLSLLSLVAGTLVAHADISDDYRNANAVALYEFAETSGDVIDTSRVLPPLNLKVTLPNGVTRTNGSMRINQPNLIRSYTPATKITSQCKASGAMSFEVWLSDNETVEDRSGIDAARRVQPLRVLALSDGLLNRNFIFGQFYDMGNLYVTGIRTSSNESSPMTLGNSLTDPLMSTVATTRLATPETAGIPGASLQKIVVTLGSSGLAKLYLSDQNGTLYLARSESRGFGAGAMASYFSNWSSTAHLALGNENMTEADFTAASRLSTVFPGCTAATNRSNGCFTNPNRFWKGVLHKVAIYCSEVPQKVVLGEGADNTIKNPIVDIDLNSQMTPLRQRALDIHSRITGLKTPISNPVISEMVALLATGDGVGAAAIATQDPSFLNITVRDFAAKMSNRDETINVPLNDFTATIVGAVRDNLNAKSLLTDNITYQADPTLAPVPGNLIEDLLRSNNHFEALSSGRYDLSKVLVQRTQKVFDGRNAVDNPNPAGLLTTRQWMAAHAIAGTNRRLIEFSFRQFACKGIDEIADAEGPENVIGVDIERFPGGSHAKYASSCRACHTIMDGFRPAFARWTFSNGFAKHALVVSRIALNVDEDTSLGMQMEPQFVAYKLNKNADVSKGGGRVTQTDEWVNNAVRGSNATLFKWTMLSGQGTASFGKAIAESAAFPQCMAQRVFSQVCKRKPASIDSPMLDKVVEEFKSQRSYNLKFLFQRIVSSPECLGG